MDRMSDTQAIRLGKSSSVIGALISFALSLSLFFKVISVSNVSPEFTTQRSSVACSTD